MEKTTILICDDETGVRESLKLILGEEYRLVYASNGEEALQSIKANNPALLILDVKMPRMGGLEVLPKARRIKPTIRILMATGYESSDVAAQAGNLGADDYLVKPFTREQVRAKVTALLESQK